MEERESCGGWGVRWGEERVIKKERKRKEGRREGGKEGREVGRKEGKDRKKTKMTTLLQQQTLCLGSKHSEAHLSVWCTITEDTMVQWMRTAHLSNFCQKNGT